MSPVGRVRLLILTFLIQGSEPLFGFSNLTSNDPYPPYSAQYPYIFLSDWPRDYYRGLDDDYHREFFVFSITPFRQTADSGKNIDKINVALGNLKGRWNMMGLFYSANPNLKLTDGDPANLLPILQLQKGGTEACPYVSPLCTPPGPSVQCPIVIDPKFADLKPYPFITTTTVTTSTTVSLIPTTTITEPGPQIGNFSVPIDYRKYGVRFSFDFRIWCDIGLKVETGVADITQIAVFNDLTPYSVGVPISGDCASDMSCVNDASANCKLLITDYIMDQLHLIAKQLGLSTKNFHTTGIEDTRVALYWQRIFPVNEKCDGWPLFLCIPFLAFEVITPTAKTICPADLFAVPLGNNGHTGFGFGTGIDFDFVDSISFGFQASMIHWLGRDYCSVPVPTQYLQAGIFPFKANYTLHPGTNWTYSMTIFAHYFLDRLSAYGEYAVINHAQDTFCDVTVLPIPGGNPAANSPVPDALVGKMSDESKWRSHIFNFGLYYDISPQVSLGFLWQAPVGRRNAYRSGTVLISSTFRF